MSIYNNFNLSLERTNPMTNSISNQINFVSSNEGLIVFAVVVAVVMTVLIAINNKG